MIGVEDLLEDYQSGHTRLQVRQFIIAKSGYTPWGMYRQCLREISTRWNALLRSMVAVPEPKPFGDAHPVVVQLAQREAGRRLRDRVRELAEFVILARHLKQAHIGDVSPERRDELDDQFWCSQLVKRAALDVLTFGRVSAETLETIYTFSGPTLSHLAERVANMTRELAQEEIQPRIQLPDLPATPESIAALETEARDAIDRCQREGLPGPADALSGDLLEDPED